MLNKLLQFPISQYSFVNKRFILPQFMKKKKSKCSTQAIRNHILSAADKPLQTNSAGRGGGEEGLNTERN